MQLPSVVTISKDDLSSIISTFKTFLLFATVDRYEVNLESKVRSGKDDIIAGIMPEKLKQKLKEYLQL